MNKCVIAILLLSFGILKYGDCVYCYHCKGAKNPHCVFPSKYENKVHMCEMDSDRGACIQVFYKSPGSNQVLADRTCAVRNVCRHIAVSATQDIILHCEECTQQFCNKNVNPFLPDEQDLSYDFNGRNRLGLRFGSVIVAATLYVLISFIV